MFEFTQSTMIDQDREVVALWFPDERGANLRPAVIKMEVGKPLRSGFPWTYTAYVWHNARAYRFTVKVAEPTIAVYAIARALEQWFVELQAAER